MTAPKIGSGLFTGGENATQGPIHQHLAQASHGLVGEVADLWRSLVALFGPAAAVAVEEFTAPATAVTNGLKTSIATVNGNVTYSVAGGTLTDITTTLAVAPRNVTLAGGGTTAQCPTSATVVGTDARGAAQTEVIALTAGSGTGVKAFLTVASVTLTGGTGVAGTEIIGFGVVLGLKAKAKARSGATTAQPPISENVDHATPTAGSIDPTNHTYTPNAAPNAAHNYTVFYEYDPTVIAVPGEI